MNTVYVVVQNGLIETAYADKGLNVDLVVLDLDTDDQYALVRVKEEIAELEDSAEYVEIY